MEYEYKDIERAVLCEMSQITRLYDIGKTTGHHKKLKIGDTTVPTDDQMNYPIFEVHGKDDEIVGYYIHVGSIDIDAFSESRFDDDETAEF